MLFIVIWMVDLKSRVEVQQTIIQQLETSMRDKERECAEKISSVREEEFQKMSQINLDK